MSLGDLSEDVLAMIIERTTEDCLSSVHGHATTERLYALLSKRQYAKMADALLFTRSATQRFMAGETRPNTALGRLALRANALGSEFTFALAKLRGEATSYGEDYTLGSVRRLLATAHLIGSASNWSPLPCAKGEALACTALYTLPPLIEASRSGKRKVSDAAFFAPLPTSGNWWTRKRRFAVKDIPTTESDANPAVDADELFLRCGARWSAYCAPVKTAPVHGEVTARRRKEPVYTVIVSIA
jgi:hypothetical protein